MPTISDEEYCELKRKAEAYDKIKSNNSKAGKISASHLTPAQRIERAKKAVQAREAKRKEKKRVS